MFSEFSHRTTVYSVCWGPAIADTTDDKSSKNASDLKKVKTPKRHSNIFLQDFSLKFFNDGF